MILLTGATGFLGSALLKKLPIQKTVTYGRTPPKDTSVIFEHGSLEVDTDYKTLLKKYEIDTIIHTAARVHVMQETTPDPIASFRQMNTACTLNLAKQAAQSGVKRFIYMSSIKVNGEETTKNAPYQATDTPHPTDPYAISKYEAEEGLKKLSQETGLEIVIIRPPLIYGPCVKANFLAMLRAIQKGIPLPLGAIHNKRSLVALDNLIDLIVTCIDHPNAANQTFLVSDDADVSTTELLQKMAEAMSKKAWLLPIPESWLRVCAKIVGKEDIISRLCGSLQVDIQHTKETLGWKPPVTMAEQLAKIKQSL